ncbi:MAG: methylenetetrahydrofolate--tRNA-(uracil(54)-C(5))-methyltransferase (FADH(2)-oxidizing) TrmFO [Pseudomonadota bacterium]
MLKSSSSDQAVHIIGAGLAGSEAAWQLAERGLRVLLHEMRPDVMTDAHKTGHCAELVCSNSFRSDDHTSNAVGVLHAEMRLAGSLIMKAADENQVPAGGALAVDRVAFAEMVTERLQAHHNVEIRHGEITALPLDEWGDVLIATGPLTSGPLAQIIRDLTGQDQLAFFDAIAPIVHKDTIDMDAAWFQSRYDKPGPGGTGADYINCPLDQAQYEAFVDALLDGETTDFKEWEENTPYFNGCLPIEIMAKRGRETLRHGPMKPVGLTNRHAPDVKPYAVVQLRQDNKLGTLYNMVGFQTKLRYGQQADIFRMIPGLQEAEFARLGGLHRNTFINSPHLLDPVLRMKKEPRVRFAGQITGCEGYLESAAVGLLAGRFIAAERLGEAYDRPPETTAFGSLLNHITGGYLSDPESTAPSYQPMNINFGLFPEIEVPKQENGRRLRGKEKGFAKKRALAARALRDAEVWLSEDTPPSLKHAS